MKELATRIRKSRETLQLSQEYLAKQLGISRSAISLIEKGKRKVTSDELDIFSRIFGISTDELIKGRPYEMPSQIFAREFQELNKIDQNEILSLIEFKHMMKDRIKK